ncbi:MAG TPA: DUF3426 domain-containing protein [Limnobacter sp.]
MFSGIDHLTAADADAWQTTHISVPSAVQATPTAPEFLGAAARPSARKVQLTRPQRWATGLLLALLLVQSLWWWRQSWMQHLPVFQQTNLPGWVLKLAAGKPGNALVVDGSGLTALDENTLRVDLTLNNQGRLPVQWPVLKVELLDPQGLVLVSKLIQPSEYQLRDAAKTAAAESPSAALAAPIRVHQTVEVLAYLNTRTLNEQLPESATTGFRVALLDPH